MPFENFGGDPIFYALSLSYFHRKLEIQQVLEVGNWSGLL